MIGNRDFRTASLTNLLTPSIVPLLHMDLRNIIEEECGSSPEAFIASMQEEPAEHEGNQNRGHHATADNILLDPSHVAAEVDDFPLDPSLRTDNPDSGVVVGEYQAAEELADGIASRENDIPEDDGWSGFGGTHPKWGPKRFWNFVDSILETIREDAKVTGKTQREQQQIYNKYVVDISLRVFPLSNSFQSVLQGYLQRDLQDFTGNAKIQRRVKQMMSSVPKKSPEWQRTIEAKLLW